MTHDEIVATGMILIGLAVCVCMVIVAWIRSRSRQEHARLRTEVQKSLLEKFSSGQELSAFLTTPGSQRFLGDLSMERRRSDIKERILRSVRAGLVISTIGLAFLILAVPSQEAKVAGLGVICLSLGLGLLLAAGVSYRLGKTWGLTNGPPEDRLENAAGRTPSPDDVLS